MNEKKISVTIISIFAIIFIILIYITKSDYYIKYEYFQFRKQKFNSIVIDKIDTHPLKGNKLILRNNMEIAVRRETFDNLKIGDSVIKQNNSDSIFFYTKNKLIIEDENKFRREKFLKTKRK